MSEKVYEFPEEALLWVRPDTKRKEVDKASKDAYVGRGGNMEIEDNADFEQVKELLRIIANEEIVILSDNGKIVGCMLTKYKPEPLKPINDDITRNISVRMKNYYISFVPECNVIAGEIRIIAHLHTSLGADKPIEIRITPFDEKGKQINLDRVQYELFAGKDEHQQSILLTIEDEYGEMFEKQIEVNCETGKWENEDDFCVNWGKVE